MRISDWSSDVCSSDLRHGETVYRCDVSLPVRLQARGRRWPEGRRQRHGKITHRRKGSRLAPGERAADRRNALADTMHGEIGRASCRERVCQYVEISVVDVQLKKKK